MTRRRVVKRRVRSAATSPVAQQGRQAQQDTSVPPMTLESLGLKPGAECEILIVGNSKYCSFTLARLGRLGIPGSVGVTASEKHAMWAVKNLSPRVVIASIDFDRRSGGIDLMRKLEVLNPSISVIISSSALDVNLDQRGLRDLAWVMGDSWSFITRRATDNGDPLGVAVVAAKQGVGWIDYPVRKQLEQWRTANNKSGRLEVALAV